MIIVFSKFLNVQHSAVKYSTGDNVMLNLPVAFTRKKVPSDLDAIETREETEC